MKTVIFKSKYKSFCSKCGKIIHIGDYFNWEIATKSCFCKLCIAKTKEHFVPFRKTNLEVDITCVKCNRSIELFEEIILLDNSIFCKRKTCGLLVEKEFIK